MSSWVVICDENTSIHCLPYFQKNYLTDINPIVLQIQAGESHKDLTQCQFIWQRMLELGIDRDSILISLGGGQVSDLSGFAASTFKRGIRLINVPTTNLAMCDAALGGKTGINLLDVKNQIGTFYPAVAVLIDAHFLNTLPENQLRSGFAETIKHALIADPKLWSELITGNWKSYAKDQRIIDQSAQIKLKIVQSDPNDLNERHALNFGHTVGHALETESHLQNLPLLHGEAIAFGMVAEAYLSVKLRALSERNLKQISAYIRSIFAISNRIHAESIVKHAQSDKKNSGGKIRCSLIANIGEPKVKVEVSEVQIFEAVDFAQRQFAA
ncbi:MAG: 3-dehydroquinate synthase [Flavobacteriales bacterium]